MSCKRFCIKSSYFFILLLFTWAITIIQKADNVRRITACLQAVCSPIVVFSVSEQCKTARSNGAISHGIKNGKLPLPNAAVSKFCLCPNNANGKVDSPQFPIAQKKQRTSKHSLPFLSFVNFSDIPTSSAWYYSPCSPKTNKVGVVSLGTQRLVTWSFFYERATKRCVMRSKNETK